MAMQTGASDLRVRYMQNEIPHRRKTFSANMDTFIFML